MFGEKKHTVFWLGLLLTCLTLAVLIFSLVTFSQWNRSDIYFWANWTPLIYWCIIVLPIGLQMTFARFWKKLHRLRSYLSAILFSIFTLWGSFEIMGCFLYVQQFLTHLCFCPFRPLIISPLAQSFWQVHSDTLLIMPILHSIIAISLFSFGWGFLSLHATQIIRSKLVDLRILYLVVGWCTFEIAGAFIYVQQISHYIFVGSPFRPLIISPLAYLLNCSYLIEQHGMIKITGSSEVGVLIGLFFYSLIVLSGLFIGWALIQRRFRNPWDSNSLPHEFFQVYCILWALRTHLKSIR